MKKITLFTADIDTKAIIKQLADYKQSLEKLKVAQKSLDTTTAKGAEQFVKNQVEIKKTRAESAKYEKVLTQLSASTGKFETVEKSLSSALKKEVTTINQARESNKKLLAIRNNLNLNTKKGAEAQVKINAQLDKNNAFIKENVSGYEKQKIGIGDYEGALRKVFPSLGGMISGLKGAKEGLEKVGIGFKRSGDSAQGATASFSGVGTSMASSNLSTEAATTSTIGYGRAQVTSGAATDKSTASTIGYAAAQKTAAVSTGAGSKALKLFRVALISTGIGAIVVALGSLIAFLSTTQAGVDAVSKVTKPLGVIFSRVFGIVQDLGAGLFEAFSNPKKLLTDLVDFIKNNVINRFKALAVIIEGFMNFDVKQIANGFAQAATGVEDVIGKVQNAGKASAKFLKESIELGNQLRKIGIEIEEKEAGIASQRAKANDEIKKQELLAKDSSKTGKERNDAAKEAARLQDEQITKEEDILRLKIQELKLNQSLNDTSREELKELDELEAELVVKGGQRRISELKFLTATTAFKKEEAKKALDRAKKAIETIERNSDAEIAASKIRLQLLADENENDNTLSKIEKARILRDERIKILDTEKQAYKDSVDFKNDLDSERQLKLLEFSQERININKLFSEENIELALNESEKILEYFKSVNQSKISESKRVNAELFAAEDERINKLYFKEIETLQQRLSENLISQEEFDASLIALNEQTASEVAALNKAFDDTEKERKITDFENALELRRQNGESEFQLRIEELDRLRAEEIRIADETGADIALINEKYDNKVTKVDDLSSKQKVDNAAKAAGQISGIMKQLAGENKEIAITAAIIDGALGIQSILAEYPKFDGGFAMVAAIAASAITTATSLSTIQKAEDGISFQGTLKGASHANGGINLGNGIEAEGGENMYTSGGNTHIVNKKASSLINRLGIMGALSYINQREGGGIALSAPTSYAQKGGLISTLGGGNVEIDYSKMAQAFEAGASRVQNTVNVNDINSANNSITQVNDFTTI